MGRDRDDAVDSDEYSVVDGTRMALRTALILVCAFSGAVHSGLALAGNRGSNSELREPAAVHLPPTEPRLDQAAIKDLATRWVRLLDRNQPQAVRPAFDLLLDTPRPLTDQIAARLAESTFDFGGEVADDWLLNNDALRRQQLQDPFSASFVQVFNRWKGLSKDQAPGFMYPAVVAAQGFRHLPVVVAEWAIGATQERSQVGVEANRLLRERGATVAYSEIKNALASAAPPNEQATSDNLTLWQLRLRADDKIDSVRVAELLSLDDSAPTLVVPYIERHPDALQNAQVKQALATRLLRTDLMPDAWYETLALAKKLQPDTLKATYAARRTGAWKNVPPGIEAALFAAADESETAWIADIPLLGKYQGCDVVRRDLAILQRKQARGAFNFEYLKSIVSEKACTPETKPGGASSIELLDKISSKLATEPSDSHPLAGVVSKITLTSPEFSKLYIADLESALMRHDENAVLGWLRMGVRLDATRLKERSYWAATYADSKKPSKADLAALQLVNEIPSSVWPVVRAVAHEDTDFDEHSDFERRAFALIALSRDPDHAAAMKTFAEAIDSTDANVARISSTLFAENLLPREDKAVATLISLNELDNFRLRTELADQAKRFHEHLFYLNDDYVAEYLLHSDGGEAPCWLFATRVPMPSRAAHRLLDASLQASEVKGKAMRICVAWLAASDDPSAIYAGRFSGEMGKDQNLLMPALQTLWSTSDQDAGLRKAISERVERESGSLPFSLDSIHTISGWKEAVATEYPQVSDQLGRTLRYRQALALAVAIPLVLVGHLILWLGIVTIYPRSPVVQSIVLWNPWARKALGLGYIDVLLLTVPFARRRMLAPFRDLLLGDLAHADSVETSTYYAGSSVRTRDEVGKVSNDTQPIVQSIDPNHRRCLLQGRSGLGKSSFLRHFLTKRTAAGDTIAYLRADECARGVEPELAKRLLALGEDLPFVRSLVHSGRLGVYIDGYNEVSLQTQEHITSFLSNYPKGRILVASQISLRGLSRLFTYELLPLTFDQALEFLRSRSTSPSRSAVVVDAAFEKSASAYLSTEWQKATDENGAMQDVLSNPMDLTTVAILLSEGHVPEPFALEHQQLLSVRAELSEQGLTFRDKSFADAVFSQREKDIENLAELDFKPEVAELVENKIAILKSFADPSGNIAKQEIRFRHDRFRDYFCCIAIKDLAPHEQAKHAADARLAGVFPFLARVLDEEKAIQLRDRLLEDAAERQDHRVFDAYQRALLTKARRTEKVPDWVSEMDSTAARSTSDEIRTLSAEIARLSSTIEIKRNVLASQRSFVQIVTTSDAQMLEELALGLLLQLGARVSQNSGPRLLETPLGVPFSVVGIASIGSVEDFHWQLALARADKMANAMLVYNANAPLPIAQRPAIQIPEMRSSLFAISAVALYESLRYDNANTSNLWVQLSEKWR